MIVLQSRSNSCVGQCYHAIDDEDHVFAILILEVMTTIMTMVVMTMTRFVEVWTDGFRDCDGEDSDSDGDDCGRGDEIHHKIGAHPSAPKKEQLPTAACDRAENVIKLNIFL